MRKVGDSGPQLYQTRLPEFVNSALSVGISEDCYNMIFCR